LHIIKVFKIWSSNYEIDGMISDYESLPEELENSPKVKQEPISPCAVVQVPQFDWDLIERDPLPPGNGTAELQMPHLQCEEAKQVPQSVIIKTEQADQEVEVQPEPLTPPTKGEDKMPQLSAEESDYQNSPGKSLDNINIPHLL
jgi:hypothetical protein